MEKIVEFAVTHTILIHMHQNRISSSSIIIKVSPFHRSSYCFPVPIIKIPAVRYAKYLSPHGYVLHCFIAMQCEEPCDRDFEKVAINFLYLLTYLAHVAKVVNFNSA